MWGCGPGCGARRRAYLDDVTAELVLGHDHDVDIAPVRLEAAQRERAVEIDPDQVVAQDRSHSGQQLLQERVDVRVGRRCHARTPRDVTGRARAPRPACPPRTPAPGSAAGSGTSARRGWPPGPPISRSRAPRPRGWTGRRTR